MVIVGALMKVKNLINDQERFFLCNNLATIYIAWLKGEVTRLLTEPKSLDDAELSKVL